MMATNLAIREETLIDVSLLQGDHFSSLHGDKPEVLDPGAGLCRGGCSTQYV